MSPFLRSDAAASGGLRRAALHRPFLFLALVIAVLGVAAPRTAAWTPAGVTAVQRPQAVTWSGFAPAGWVADVPATSLVTATAPDGFIDGRDAYATSVDGGATWSDWSTAGLSVSSPQTSVRELVVIGLAFPDSATQNLIRYRTAEASGEEAISPAYTIKVDTTPPDPPTLLTGTPARRWSNVNSFSESWRNPEDLSGIAGAYYKLNALPAAVDDGIYVATTNTISNISVPRDGTHDIWVWLVDGAGNVDHTLRTGDPGVFWYDGTLPVSSVQVAPPLPATGWYTSSVRIDFTATDLPVDETFPPAVWTQLDGAAWAVSTGLTVGAEGTHRLLYQARDKAGNLEAAKELRFGIDLTPPVATLTADRLPAATGWYTAPVTYTLAVTDAVSGGATGYYRLNDGPWQQGAGFTLAADGSYRIESYAVDAAGLRSAVNTIEAHLDGTAPLTSTLIDGVAGDNGWYRSPVTVTLQPVDPVSGVLSTRFRIGAASWESGIQFPLPANAIHEIAYASTDVAGNEEAPVEEQIKLDAVAPGAPIGLQASPSGWSSTNAFTVAWSAPEDLSGVSAAYYKFGEPPAGPGDGTVITATDRIDALAVPIEGAQRLYLWLRDAAGNADHTTAVAGPTLRYDATPPVTVAEVEGLAGTNGWYRSPVTVTLTAGDTASGVASLYYRINGGEWQWVSRATATLALSQSDKHAVEYFASDVAGNSEAVQALTVRIDLDAPPPPDGVRSYPQGWSAFNNFRLEWPPVLDQSGIAGAYVKFGAPPANDLDGEFYVGATEITGVRAPGEGRFTAYVWLVDGAGNADEHTAVAITDAIWYDSSSPVTVITLTAASGLNGWYIGPVAFSMSATDSGSGVAAIRYQIDDGPVETGTAFTYGEDGQHTVRIWAVDVAGNVEATHVYDLSIDRTPPLASFSGLSGYQTRTRFDVSWSATDGAGSGVETYDVQVRDGYDGAWMDWLRKTKQVSAQFDGQRSHTYFFRVFATDRAGNRQPNGATAAVLVEPIQNGGFDTGTLSDWMTGGSLFMAVAPTAGPGNTSILAARLGSEDYGPSLQAPGTVPVGSATISQTVSIPALDQVRRPHLRFWYRVLTYDVMYSQRLERYVDTLDVTLYDAQGNEIALLLRAGNPTNAYGTRYDTGWHLASIDLSPYAGQTVQISFASWNRHDNLFNTWSFVDGIQIRDRVDTYIPSILRDADGSGASVSAASAADTREEAVAPASDEGSLR